MDRQTFYYGEILRALDLLESNQNTMVGLAKLSLATLGNSPALKGLALSPGPGLTVYMAPGDIYQQAPLEATPLSLLPPDSHIIIKQGISLDQQTVTGFTAPASPGPANVYLIEVQYQDFDAGAVVLPYWNAADPAVQYNGPGNSGATQSYVRQGIVAWQIKGPAGSVPAPDSGWVGLGTITIPYGTTSILSGMIASYGFPPFIPTNLPEIPSDLQNGKFVFAQDTGTSNAYVINPTSPILAYVDGQKFRIQILNANTGASTLSVSGLSPVPWVRTDGTVLHANDVVGNMEAEATYNSALASFELLFPSPYAWGGVDTGTAVGWWVGWVF